MKTLTKNGSGGAIYSFRISGITAQKCFFKENTATYSGGAICMIQATGSFVKCTFERNSVKSLLQKVAFGGAIYAEDNSHLTMHHCIFKENTATFGGATHIQKSQSLFESCTFERNKVNSLNQDTSGGAINALCADTNMTIKLFLFKENAATGSGGAIHNERSRSLLLRNSTFVRNAVKALKENGTGGAIASLRNSDITVQQCLFKENTATFSGGAILMQETQGSFEDCTFVDNTAQNLQGMTFGGAIAFGDHCSYIMKQCLFKKNNATFYGGACYIQESQVSFENCTFEGKV